MRRRTWTICRWNNREIEVSTTSIENGDVLPVFGFEEEAEMYPNLQEPGSGWRIRETTNGELISILHGPCARVRWIALDPPPEVCKRMHALSAGLDRRAFLRTLADAPAPTNPSMRHPQRATRAGEDGDGSGPGPPCPPAAPLPRSAPSGRRWSTEPSTSPTTPCTTFRPSKGPAKRSRRRTRGGAGRRDKPYATSSFSGEGTGRRRRRV